MMMLCTALAGGEVMSSSTGRPMFRPPPDSAALEPTPMIVLSEVTLCMPSVVPVGRVIVPATWMTYGPGRAM